MGINILPATRAYFNTHVGQSQTRELIIATIGEGPIEAHVIASKPNIHVSLQRLDDKRPEDPDEYWRQYKLLITIPENFPEGRFAESVTLATNSENTFSIKIPVAGSVTPSLVVSPATVRIIYNTTKGTLPNRTIKITKMAGADLKVTKVIADPPQLRAELQETAKGKQYAVHLNWQDTSTKGHFNGRVIIHTNDSQKPVIDVPVYVIIK